MTEHQIRNIGEIKAYDEFRTTNSTVNQRISQIECGNCKFMRQGPKCCQCGNPEQKDKGLIDYVNYNMKCRQFIHEEFHKMTDEEKLAAGYTKDFFEWGFEKWPCWKLPKIKPNEK